MQQFKDIIKKIRFVDDIYVRFKWRERKVACGNEEGDKTFYVIRRATCKVGLFSYVMTNLGQIEYALKRGYIPVIDMQNNENTYLEKDLVGRANAWEYYFKQPMGYSLEDIKKCKNVILGKGVINTQNEYPTEEIAHNPKEFERWHKLGRNYLILQDEIQNVVDQEYKKMFGKDRVLGILCRGTDYVRLRPHGHPVQPTIKQMIEKADQMRKRCKCKWIYLATEDEEYYQAFREAFGEVLKVTDAKRCAKDGKFNINDISYGRENERFLKGKEYLINVAILAKCTCLLAGATGGTYGAMLLSEGFEEQYIFDLGLYE